MKIVIKKVGQAPEVKEIKGELHEMQEIVGGYLEVIGLFGSIFCVLNEEGKLKGLPINFIFGGDFIVGNVFFCSVSGGDFASLDDYQADVIMRIFSVIENNKRT